MSVARMLRSWWVPAIILVAGAALVGGLQTVPSFDNGTAFMASTAAGLFIGFLLLVWVLFFAGFGKRHHGDC